MPWQIELATDSYRTATEDRAGFWPTEYGFLLAVADGMGGRAGGALAAETALGGIAAYARWPAFPSPNALADLLQQIDLDASKRPDMGETSAIVCALSERGMSFAAVGDSAAWWVTNNQVMRLGTEAYRKPWIGSGISKPLPFACPLKSAGTLLLMTDGVWKYADQILLANHALQPDSTPSQLIDLARMKSGTLQDDAAVVVARYATTTAD